MQKAIKRYFPVFVLPTLIAFTIGFLAPFVLGVYLSFCKFTTVTDARFIGLGNYAKILGDGDFLHSLWFTALFTIVTVLLINIFAFAVAMLLTKKIKGTNIFRTVFFIPDRNLAHYIAGLVPEKNFIYNEGFCIVHEYMEVEEIKAAKAAHPEAEVLSHPECPAKVLELSDFVGSTSEIIAQAGKSDAKEFIICTESGVLYELQKRNPEKKFYFTETTPICRNMKKVTLEKVLHVLKTGKNEVFVDDKLREESKKPLERMLELAK